MLVRIADVLAALQLELEQYARTNNTEAFNRLRLLVFHPEADPVSLSPSPSTNRNLNTNAFQSHGQYQASISSSPFGPAPIMSSTVNGSGPSMDIPFISFISQLTERLGPLVFKTSPFYTIIEPLTPVLECKGW